MKYAILIAALLSSTAACAEVTVRGTIEDHYRTVNRSVPETRQVCEVIEVPIYGRSQATTGDALAGAIIGGVIGNQFGNGSGKDAMTVLGAIVGADVANKQGSRQIIGYRQGTECSNQTFYVETPEQIYSHSTITFRENGRTFTVRFQKY